jgi:hypothetical protein
MKFAELDRKVQEKLLQAEVENLDYEWWDCTEEGYKEDGKERGFDIEKMFFSGFCSQGDGASWVGTVDIKRFLAHHLKPENPQFAQYTILQELLRDGSIDASVGITAAGRYSHEYTMRCNAMDRISYDDDDVVVGGLMDGANVGELYEGIGGGLFLDEMGCWILEQAQNYAREYYKALEQEYYYLTGEECLAERDLDYDEDGEELADAGESVSPQLELELTCLAT